MKKIFLFLSALVLFFALSGVSGATMYIDTYDAGHRYMRSHVFLPDDGVSWTFNITDDGFDPVTQDITSAVIKMNFSDDSWFDFYEIAELNIGTNTFRWGVNTGNESMAITSLITLNDDGIIDCMLTADVGDFYFNTATLLADDSPSSDPVPEPATILLMGTGLVGIVRYCNQFIKE